MGLHERFQNERAWSKGRPEVSTGADIEKAMFGAPHIPRALRKDEYMSYAAALAYARDHQPNPLDRSKSLKELRAKILSLCSDTMQPMKFYTAIGTPLDTYHGIDAFFEQGSTTVTLDVSGREKENHKADVLIHARLNDDGELVCDSKEIDRVAREVAHRLNRNYHKKAA